MSCRTSSSRNPRRGNEGSSLLIHAYRDTVKEFTRTSNRIWSVCSRKGYALPGRSSCAKVESLRKTIEETGIGGFAKDRLEMLLEDCEAGEAHIRFAARTRDTRRRNAIRSQVKLMQ